MGDGAYVVRSSRSGPAGMVTYELVDMAGQLLHVTVPRALSTSEWAHPVLRHAVANRPHAPALPT